MITKARTTKINPETYKKIKLIAVKNNITVQDLINSILIKYLENER